MKIKDWVKRHYGFDDLGRLKLFLVIVIILVLQMINGLLERLGNYLWDSSVEAVPSATQYVGQKVISFLFYRFDINTLTLITGIITFIPLYHYLIRFSLSSKKVQQIFSDNFKENTPYMWRGPYWEKPNDNIKDTVVVANGFIIFSALPGRWTALEPDQNGALIDIKDGIYNGLTYEIRCLARSEQNTTMGFKLWVHDTVGGPGMSVTTGEFRTPPSDRFEEYKVRFVATITNAIRIHLHCRAGNGKIMVSEVTVTKIGR